MWFVVTGPQRALHGYCMVGEGLDIVGQISTPWSYYLQCITVLVVK